MAGGSPMPDVKVRTIDKILIGSQRAERLFFDLKFMQELGE